MYTTLELSTTKEVKEKTKGLEIRLSIAHGYISISQQALCDFIEIYGYRHSVFASREDKECKRIYVYIIDREELELPF